MNRFDNIRIGDGCPRHADRRVIAKTSSTIECAPNAQPVEYARAHKTGAIHDLATYADDSEGAADFELALEQAGVPR